MELEAEAAALMVTDVDQQLNLSPAPVTCKSPLFSVGISR